MTRILFWNIETFGINSIENPSDSKIKGVGGNLASDAAYERYRQIQKVFLAALPDIIVIVEVASGDTFPGDLASLTGGMEGASRLLTYLRSAPLFSGGNWRLVPPLRVGRSGGSKPETVAVLYRGTSDMGMGQTVTRYFTGPNVWTGGYNGASVETGRNVAYPKTGPNNNEPDLNAMLVPPGTTVRTIPGTALHNANRKEDVVAARTAFHIDDAGVEGEYLEWGPFRPPYMTTFTEVSSGGAVRHLTLFGVHSPAVSGKQDLFMTYMGNTWEVVRPLAPAETRVVCGDFNLRLLNEDGSYSGVYDALTAQGYTLLLRPPPGGPPAPLDGFIGYFGTHLREALLDKKSRFMWDSEDAKSYYPGYRYVGSQKGANLSSLDNILVRPHVPTAAYDTTILNSVVGSPMGAIAPAPGGAPVGTLYLSSMFDDPELLPAAPPAAAGDYPGMPTAKSITGWSNFGRIRSTSDHFALYADIP